MVWEPAIGTWLKDTFDPNYLTDEEQRAQDLQDKGDSLWDDILASTPTIDQLTGRDLIDFSPEALGMPPRPGSGKHGATTREQLAAWEREYASRLAQAQADPFFGLGVSDDAQLAGAGADQRTIDAQMSALDQMRGIYDAGGYTDAERAQLQMAQRDAAMGERSQRLAVQQQAASRGMGGGGMELMGALSAQQGGANRANDWGNQIAIAGQQRALQALTQSGNWAGQARGQSFNEDVTRRSAADAWNQYRTGIAQDFRTDRGNAYQTQYADRMDATAGATDQYAGSTARQDQIHDEKKDQMGQLVGAGATALGYAFGGPAGAAIGGSIF